MVADYQRYTDLVEYFDEPTEEAKLATQRLIASRSESVEDAIDLLMMLGVHPDQLKEEKCQKEQEQALEEKRRVSSLQYER